MPLALDLLLRFDALPWWRKLFKPRDFKRDVHEMNIQREAIRLNKILTDLANDPHYSGDRR